MAAPDRPDFDEVIATEWGDWVHDTLTGIKRYEVALSYTGGVVGAGLVGLTGSITVPTASFDRLCLCAFTVYCNVTGNWLDLGLNVPGGTRIKRVRTPIGDRSVSLATAYPLPAGASGSYFSVNAQTAGTNANLVVGTGLDMSWLEIVTIPIT